MHEATERMAYGMSRIVVKTHNRGSILSSLNIINYLVSTSLPFTFEWAHLGCYSGYVKPPY